MVTVRRGVFETNSSSTHSITILEGQEKIDLYNKDELYVDDENNYKSEKELIEEFGDDPIVWADNEYKLLGESDCLELDEHIHTTKNGDEILIICQYGYDS